MIYRISQWDIIPYIIPYHYISYITSPSLVLTSGGPRGPQYIDQFKSCTKHLLSTKAECKKKIKINNYLKGPPLKIWGPKFGPPYLGEK